MSNKEKRVNELYHQVLDFRKKITNEDDTNYSFTDGRTIK